MILCNGLKYIETKKYNIFFSVNIIKGLIYFFLIGYIAFLINIFRNISSQGMTEFLVSIIFFFGAIFVVIILKINCKLIIYLSEKSIDLQKLNKNLKSKNYDLIQKSKALIISEKKYKDQTEELETMLDDFYTIRLGMEEQVKKDVLEEENKKIKEKIKQLKNK